MDDRELLERAAKAAGIELTWREPSCGGGELPYVSWGSYTPAVWNPLRDDGDEARLEGALLMNVSWGMASVTVDGCTERFSDHGGDKQKARRYAGTRAAAAMGGE